MKLNEKIEKSTAGKTAFDALAFCAVSFYLLLLLNIQF